MALFTVDQNQVILPTLDSDNHFSKNTPFFVNSIISPNTLTKSYDSTSTSSTYFIQKYSIKKFSLPKKPLNGITI